MKGTIEDRVIKSDWGSYVRFSAHGRSCWNGDNYDDEIVPVVSGFLKW